MDIANILFKMCPGQEWTLNSNNYEDLVWLSETKKPTLKEIKNFEKEAELLVALENLRAKRNQLLAESDWTQVNDSPVDKEAWADYRQSLRDLPESTDPLDPVWPVLPE